jgi:hypothetical protein
MSGGSLPNFRTNRLNHDGLSNTGIEAEPRVAYLAKQVGALADQPDFTVFAEAHFPETIVDIVGSGQVFDAHERTRRNAVQRAYIARRTFVLAVVGLMRVAHLGVKLERLRLSCKKDFGANLVAKRLSIGLPQGSNPKVV